MVFDNTEKAALEWAKNEWDICDALAEEVILAQPGKPQASDFAECLKELKKHGYSGYTKPNLLKRYLTALRFSAVDRDPKLGWEHHCAAETPNNLKKCVGSLRHTGMKITPENIAKLVKCARDCNSPEIE
jgi:hypothetical protein